MTTQEKPVATRWVSLSDCARETGIQMNKLSRMIIRHHLEFRKNMRDERVRLIDVEAVKRLLGE